MISSDSVQPFGVDFVDTLTGPDLRTGSELSLETETVVNDNIISRREVRKAFKAWTQALVDISQTYKNDGFDVAEALAGDVIDGAYAYELGAVAFKPTWASEKPRSGPAGMVLFPISSAAMMTSTTSASPWQ